MRSRIGVLTTIPNAKNTLNRRLAEEEDIPISWTRSVGKNPANEGQERMYEKKIKIRYIIFGCRRFENRSVIADGEERITELSLAVLGGNTAQRPTAARKGSGIRKTIPACHKRATASIQQTVAEQSVQGHLLPCYAESTAEVNRINVP
jgi:hypothetical protein